MTLDAKLDELFTASLTGFFAARGVLVKRIEVSPSCADFAGIIGFSGEPMRGMIGIGMGARTLERLMSDHDKGHRHGNQDWLSEVANQLLGRFKGKVLVCGVSLGMALPSVLTGERLQLFTQGDGLRSFTFESPVGPIWAWLAAEVQPGLELVEPKEFAQALPGEGDLVLFD